MATRVEDVLQELLEVEARIASGDDDPELAKKRSTLTERLVRLNMLLEDKGKVLKG